MNASVRRAIASLLVSTLLAGWPLANVAARVAAPTRNVYWRIVGHLSEADREFHFVVTFAKMTVPSRRDVSLAAFEITGDDPHAYIQEQRLARPEFGDTALHDEPLELRVDDWRLRAGAGRESLRLAVRGDRGDIELTLRGHPHLVSVGSGRERSAALAASGTLVIDGHRHAVRGLATIERIAGGAIDVPQADWSWFDIQLDDGRSLIVDERRDALDHTASIAGALQARDGRVSPLLATDLDASEWGRCSWESAATGARYPTVWDVTLRGQRLVLQATVREQEIVPSIGGPAVWEGAADVLDAATDARIGWAIVTMRGIGAHPLACGG
jgi:predicted secreted hydrolase